MIHKYKVRKKFTVYRNNWEASLKTLYSWNTQNEGN